jgi:hypothetical protein
MAQTDSAVTAFQAVETGLVEVFDRLDHLGRIVAGDVEVARPRDFALLMPSPASSTRSSLT